MKPIMTIALFAGLLAFTGCATHRAGGNCNQCHAHHGHAACQDDCHGHRGGLLSRLKGPGAVCESCQGGVPVGCRPGPLHWQQGGLDYSAGLSTGLAGHRAGRVMAAQPVAPGPPSGTVGYPYYTTRGPRDFLLDNPPSIGR